ncbi:hypothetical protein BN1095_690003 [Clostridioides difficile]|uniref:Uncharacterized protein n=1 Tax=Clostridioides difficile TaxID=1496 RepID=A0A069AYQ7_CLODI|nr:hypothetical protein [Clostridioides difficile]CDT73532.1 hypothetical protein BN1095_690003 [Clostridioides difficile]
MNNLLFLIGVIALSNGNISIFDDKNKSKGNNRVRKNKKMQMINFHSLHMAI